MSNKKMEMVATNLMQIILIRKWFIGIFSVVFFMSQILPLGIAYEPPSNTATTYTPTRPALTGSDDPTAADSKLLSGSGTYNDPYVREKISFNDNVWTRILITYGYDGVQGVTDKGVKTEDIKFKHIEETFRSDEQLWNDKTLESAMKIDGTLKREENSKGTKETKDATVENWGKDDKTGQYGLRSKLKINEIKETLTQQDKTEKLVSEHIFTLTQSYGDHPMNESDTTDIRYQEGKALNGVRLYVKYEKNPSDALETHNARVLKDETGNISHAYEYWKLKNELKPRIEYTYPANSVLQGAKDQTFNFIQGGRALNKGIWAMIEEQESILSWDKWMDWIRTKRNLN